ncbi:hypothetical protein BDQ17DRAFT_948772 [Cyathus striatus]|nr:hypothetical protein BDQ17DRAFT_948772 [Cyathus striatus]
MIHVLASLPTCGTKLPSVHPNLSLFVKYKYVFSFYVSPLTQPLTPPAHQILTTYKTTRNPPLGAIPLRTSLNAHSPTHRTTLSIISIALASIPLHFILIPLVNNPLKPFIGYLLRPRTSFVIPFAPLLLRNAILSAFVKDSYERAVGWGDRCESEQGDLQGFISYRRLLESQDRNPQPITWPTLLRNFHLFLRERHRVTLRRDALPPLPPPPAVQKVEEKKDVGVKLPARILRTGWLNLRGLEAERELDLLASG